MADWCKHFNLGGIFSSDTCDVSGRSETIPSSYEYYCKNNGYKCPWYEAAYGPSSGCFITTITCDILGKDDKDYVLESLRKFRDNILQKKDEYEAVLKVYDKIGPVVACSLFNDKDREEKAAKLYSKLNEFVEVIDRGEYSKATRNYIMMTLRLVSEYGMQEKYRSLRDNNFGYKEGEFDQKTAGHGKKIEKTLEK